MSENNIEARDRYYAEVSLQLSKAGFAPQPQEAGYLPVDWNGSRLCRLTTKDGVLYKDEDVERSGGREALDRAIDVAGTTAEYMRCMESARNRQAETVGGGYTVLSEYNGIVFAAKENEQFGCEFVTWERTYDNKGVTVGHYMEGSAGAELAAGQMDQRHRRCPNGSRGRENDSLRPLAHLIRTQQVRGEGDGVWQRRRFQPLHRAGNHCP